MLKASVEDIEIYKNFVPLALLVVLKTIFQDCSGFK